MVDAIIADMGSLFRKGTVSGSSSFLFMLDDATIAVTIDSDSYAVEKGAAVDRVDCTCKTSAEMFRKIWYDGYRPGIVDFLSKEIRCDAPLLLPQFLKAFGK